MLLIIGRFQIKAEQTAAFRAFAKDAIEHSDAMAGCLSFEILQDIMGENRFMMLETWQDRASLNRHFDTEDYVKADAQLNELLVGEAEWQEFEI